MGGWTLLPVARKNRVYDDLFFYIGIMSEDPPPEYDRAGDPVDAEGYPSAAMPIAHLFLSGSVTVSYQNHPDQVFSRGSIYNRINIHPNRTNQSWVFPVKWLGVASDAAERSWSVSAVIIGAGNQYVLSNQTNRVIGIIGDGTGVDQEGQLPYEELSVIDVPPGDSSTLVAETETAVLILTQV